MEQAVADQLKALPRGGIAGQSWQSFGAVIVLERLDQAAALIDRLIHHGEVYYLQGESYRLRGKKVCLEPPENGAEGDPEGPAETPASAASPAGGGAL